MALTWKAESKDRKNIVLEGRSNVPEHKTILNKVKQILVKAAESGTANKGEKFKVSIINNGKTTDAWVMVAKPPRSAGKLLMKSKVSKAAKPAKATAAKKAAPARKKPAAETTAQA